MVPGGVFMHQGQHAGKGPRKRQLRCETTAEATERTTRNDARNAYEWDSRGEMGAQARRQEK